MPFITEGKCIFKKNPDGSKGKKVGCTEGNVKAYMKALYSAERKKAGPRRFGKPRTDEERRLRHQRLYGTSKLPPRGSGLKHKAWARYADPGLKYYGEIDYRKKTLVVNPTKGEVIDSAMHEELHRKYPDKTEKQVRKLAKRWMKKASMVEMGNLLKQYRRKPGKKTPHYKTT